NVFYSLSLHDALPIYQRRRRVALLAVLGEHDLDDLVGRVEPHEIEQGERAHRIVAAELHRLVDVRHAPDPALYRPNGVEHIGDEDRKSTRLNSSHVAT